MARRKNLEVDRFKHARSGIEVIIYLRPDNKFCTNELFGETFYANTAEELTRSTWKFLEDSSTLTFLPVIELVKVEPFHTHGSFVGIDSSRFWYAENRAGDLFRVGWEDGKQIAGGAPPKYIERFYPHNVRYEDIPFRPPVTFGKYTYLPYNDDTWNGVVELENIIRRAHDRVEELRNHPQAHLAFMFAGLEMQQLLTEGEDE